MWIPTPPDAEGGATRSSVPSDALTHPTAATCDSYDRVTCPYKSAVARHAGNRSFTRLATFAACKRQRLSAMAFAEQPTADQLFAKVDEIRKAHPDNRCTKYLTREYFDSLDDEKKAVLWRCVKTGIENPDSGLGVLRYEAL